MASRERDAFTRLVGWLHEPWPKWDTVVREGGYPDGRSRATAYEERRDRLTGDVAVEVRRG